MSRRLYAEDAEAVHTWFGFTYSNYLVLPRSVLQSMDDKWQKKFVECLEEFENKFGNLEWPEKYDVRAKNNAGRYIKDPIPHYNRGRTKLEPK